MLYNSRSGGANNVTLCFCFLCSIIPEGLVHIHTFSSHFSNGGSPSSKPICIRASGKSTIDWQVRILRALLVDVNPLLEQHTFANDQRSGCIPAATPWEIPNRCADPVPGFRWENFCVLRSENHNRGGYGILAWNPSRMKHFRLGNWEVCTKFYPGLIMCKQ